MKLNDIQIEWSKPDASALCIEHYQVSIKFEILDPLDRKLEIPPYEKNVTDLKIDHPKMQCVKYNIQVKAMSSASEFSSESEQYNVEVAEIEKIRSFTAQRILGTKIEFSKRIYKESYSYCDHTWEFNCTDEKGATKSTNEPYLTDLQSNMDYKCSARVQNRAGWSDPKQFSIIGEKNSTAIIFFILIGICVMVSLLVVGFIKFRQPKQMLPLKKKKAKNDISIKDFVKSYEDDFGIDDTAKLREEYSVIDNFSNFIVAAKCTSHKAKANMPLNRYINILPFDHNLVPLNFEENIYANTPTSTVSSYINASFIDGYQQKKEYIAAQGPLPETCYDFWSMIIQNKVEAIVMLTQTVESGKTKCEQYYPNAGCQLTYNDLKVTNTLEVKRGNFIKRILTIECNNLQKTVDHFHFITWPDHGCPKNPEDLINFTQFIQNQLEQFNSNSPLIVHCSAGFGRTGTFIVVDIMLRKLQDTKTINIFDIVKKLRSQRVKMVQTVEQYLFLYDCALKLAKDYENRGFALKFYENIKNAWTSKRVSRAKIGRRTREETGF